jgi:putative transposase
VRAAVVKSLPQALTMMKEMNIGSTEDWSDDYHEFGRRTIGEFLQYRMRESVADHLGRLSEGVQDRRNGTYVRHVLTELGDVVVSVPRARRYIPSDILTAYGRRTREVDRLILACFLLGLSTRKVGKALCTILGEKVSPATVSRVSRTLDEAVAAFHKRKLSNTYRTLVFDGIILSRKTGMGPLRRPVLVVLGIRHDGKKEVIDFRLATSESGAA